MTTHTHTHGPWTLGPKHKDSSYRLDSKANGIFHLVPFTSGLKDADANARLIAAAPELLDLLKDSRKALVDPAYYRKDLLLTAIDNAIAKAEGNKETP